MGVFETCAALLGLLAAALALNVSRLRRRKKVSLGDGGDAQLLAAIRAFGNFMEFVPFCLVLIAMLEDHYGARTIATLSVGLLAGRVLHAGGMLGLFKPGRVGGSVLTLVVLVAASGLLLAAKLHLFGR